jgi:WD40 repeat protein
MAQGNEAEGAGPEVDADASSRSTDAFISYSRRDGEFVDRLVTGLRERGKQVWLDTGSISDAEVFPDAIRRAIESSEAFVFVISPASVASAFCEQEVGYASELGKRIVPLVRVPVPDEKLPQVIRERNWIPATDDQALDGVVDRTVAAVDTDLVHRNAHTRWLLKAVEWQREGRDRTYLLRGSELAAAEGWLASAGGKEPSPTDLQRTFVTDSRRAATVRQRRLLGVAGAVTIVALALLVFALISRNQATTQATESRAKALAAQSQTLIDTDPEASVVLAKEAVGIDPAPQNVYALRRALDDSALRWELPPTSTSNQCSPVSEFVPGHDEILQITGTPTVIARSATTRAVEWRRPIPSADNCTSASISPSGSEAAIGRGTDVDEFEASSGARITSFSTATDGGSSLPGSQGTPAEVAISRTMFTEDGSYIAAVGGTNDQDVYFWDTTTGSGTSREFPGSISCLAPLSGHDMVLYSAGTLQIVDATNGATVRSTPLGSSTDTGCATPSPSGSELAVYLNADDNGAVPSSPVSIWDTATLAPVRQLHDFGEINVDVTAWSPDGTRLAIGLADGQASVWDADTGQELAPFIGQDAAVTGVSFNSDGSLVLVSTGDGTSRAYAATGSALDQFSAAPPGDGLGPFLVHGSELSGMTNSIGGGGWWDTWSLQGAPRSQVALTAPNSGANLYFVNPIIVAVQEDSSTSSAWTATVRRLPDAHVVATIPDLDLGASTATYTGTAELTENGKRLVSLQDVSATGLTLKTYTPSGHLVGSRQLTDAQLPGYCGYTSFDSSDGLTYVLGDYCGNVYVVPLRGGPIRSFDTGGRTSTVTVSPDGSSVAIASWNGVTTELRLADLSVQARLLGDPAGITAAMFNGPYLVTGSASGVLDVWEASSGVLLRTLNDPEPIQDINFGPGGTLVTADAAGTVRVWDLCTDCQDPSALVQLANERTVPHLTPNEEQLIRQSGG